MKTTNIYSNHRFDCLSNPSSFYFRSHHCLLMYRNLKLSFRFDCFYSRKLGHYVAMFCICSLIGQLVAGYFCIKLNILFLSFFTGCCPGWLFQINLLTC